MKSFGLFGALVCVNFLALPAAAADGDELHDGARIVFLGNTLIEREQRTGYWETLLTLRFPQRRLQFRNLGWSGDTVFGEARAGFGTPADGFKHLREHVLAVQPTVLILGYGLNESFAGEAGLPHFVDGLRTLLDALAPAKARLVFLTPLQQENLGAPLPDPTKQNGNLRRYGEVLRQAAQQRDARLVDLFAAMAARSKEESAIPWTDNGIHLTPFGYWQTARVLERGLGLTPLRWRYEKTLEGAPRSYAFTWTSETLPPPLPPEERAGAAADAAPVLRLRGLAAGRYRLKIDGQPITTASAEQWAAGVPLLRGPELDQVERLRQAIIEKNRLYFYRWRPQNETYLFGFRKQEQGQNAREIPQFDPLVAAQEEVIARLTIPVAHRYELLPIDEKER